MSDSPLDFLKRATQRRRAAIAESKKRTSKLKVDRIQKATGLSKAASAKRAREPGAGGEGKDDWSHLKRFFEGELSNHVRNNKGVEWNSFKLESIMDRTLRFVFPQTYGEDGVCWKIPDYQRGPTEEAAGKIEHASTADLSLIHI